MIAALMLWFALDATHQVRVYATHALDAANARITRAVIVIHGSGRNAERALATTVDAAERAHVSAGTIVLAPQFASTLGVDCRDTLEAHEVDWGCDANNGWQAGGTAADSEQLTTFDLVDRLVEQLSRRERFPSLKTIVIAGFSAGGQFVTRYSMANQVHGRSRVALRYVVGSPSSYAYPDAMRAGDSSGCSIYDDWPYGLRDRHGYAARLTAEQLARQVAERPVTYLLGALDNTTMRGLDTTCAAMAQGASRRQRGELFVQHLRNAYHVSPTLAVVPGCAHDDRCVFTSAPALAALFPPAESR
jgi:hypothetical protein